MRFIPSALTVAVSLLGTARAVQTSFQLTGKTLVLGNVSYFVPPTPVSQLKIGNDVKTLSLLSSVASPFAGEVIPITVIPTNTTSFGQRQFEDSVASFMASDDVFSESFLTGKRQFHFVLESN